jgi:16S rRNA (uracil1498-N3)-methyltransferase
MRCYIAPEAWDPGRLVPGPDETHHLLHVLRVGEGDRLEVFDGRGRTADAEVTEATRSRLVLRAGATRNVARPRPAVVLVQALPKTQKMEWIIQKGTELGMLGLVPVVTHRVVTRPDERRGAKKRARWEAVAVGAARQCGSAWIPEIAPIQKLSDWVRAGALPECLLFGDLAPGAPPLRQVLRDLDAAPPAGMGFVIGPEGDFDADERAMLLEAGARPVSLGDRVLRVETAALFVLSAVRYELG